jgi:hypothetical protein
MTHYEPIDGMLLVSEGEYQLLCRGMIDGRPAPFGTLISIPLDDEPEAVVTIRRIDIAILRFAIACGEIRIVPSIPGSPTVPIRRSRGAKVSLARLAMDGLLVSSSSCRRPHPKTGTTKRRRPSNG